MQYSRHASLAFDVLAYICRDINRGWLLRRLHANGASIFFICLYLHIGRGMYYRSYILFHTWIIGVTLFLSVIATAFLGYVLPWGQISLWGASVITNLLSTVPYIGNDLVKWLWGGFSVETPTLTRFFALHFALPFIISAIVIVHIIYLHQSGSINPLGIKSQSFKIVFHPYYTLKDLLGIIILILILIRISLYSPYRLGDPENFIPANPLNSPPHIQPEWYYLFAYAILRSIPNKLGGVIALLLSVLILYLLPFLNNKKFLSYQFYPFNQIILWVFFSNIFLLTWIGAQPVENPYLLIGQFSTFIYFTYFLIEFIVYKLREKLFQH